VSEFKHGLRKFGTPPFLTTHGEIPCQNAGKNMLSFRLAQEGEKKALEIPCQNAGTCPGNPHLSKKKTSPDFPRCSQACCLGLGFLVTCQLSQRIRGLSTTWDGNMGIPWNIQDANKLP
jgi:hypothetical protein